MITIPYYETSNFMFSNFSAHLVTYDDVTYFTAEHAFHAQKFTDEDTRNQIKNCASPIAAWEMAQKLKSKRRADWDNIKVGILTEIIRCKLEQNPDVMQALLTTGNQEIIEVNPHDSFWGNGPDGNGKNMTGLILMQIRKDLQS